MTRVEELLAEILDHARHDAHRQTEVLSGIRGLTANHVLTTRHLTLNAAGCAELTFSVVYAAVAVSNFTAADVTVVAGPQTGTAPTGGDGVQVVRTNTGRCVALTGTILSLYGTEGGEIDVIVYSKPQPPAGWVA